MLKHILFLACLITSPSIVEANVFGTVESVSGEAILIDSSEAQLKITSGMQIHTGQRIQTETTGEVVIVSHDRGIVAVRPNSTLRIDSYQAQGDANDSEVFSLLKGAARFVTGWLGKNNPSAYRLKTPTATIGIRGTDHETVVLATAKDKDQPGTYNSVYEGETVIHTSAGELAVHTGQHAFAAEGQHSSPRILEHEPGFLKQRSLQLEGRILQKKAELQDEVIKRLKELPSRARSVERAEDRRKLRDMERTRPRRLPDRQ